MSVFSFCDHSILVAVAGGFIRHPFHAYGPPSFCFLSLSFSSSVDMLEGSSLVLPFDACFYMLCYFDKKLAYYFLFIKQNFVWWYTHTTSNSKLCYCFANTDPHTHTHAHSHTHIYHMFWSGCGSNLVILFCFFLLL